MNNSSAPTGQPRHSSAGSSTLERWHAKQATLCTTEPRMREFPIGSGYEAHQAQSLLRDWALGDLPVADVDPRYKRRSFLRRLKDFLTRA